MTAARPAAHQNPARTTHPTVRCALWMAALATASHTGLAQPIDDPFKPSVYVQTAVATHGNSAWTLGTTQPWQNWRRTLWGSELRGYWDVYVSQWSADGNEGRLHTTLIGATPGFRLVPDAGHSRWFLDAGIGATLANRLYRTRYKEFGTRWNFSSHIGVGLALGAQRQHALQLRLQHVSNAGLKHPNPGENFVQLRYTLNF